jgi:hypothetical protein
LEQTALLPWRGCFLSAEHPVNFRQTTHVFAIVVLLCALVSTAHSEEAKFEIGFRGNVLLGDGVPANDILGFGVIGRYYLRDGWFAAAAVDTYDYDFERPSKIIGVPQDPAVKDIDASASNMVLSGFVGRRYGNSSRGFDWFWMAGLGVGSPDVDDVSGPTAAGGTFDLTFDANTEVHVSGVLGTSYRYTPAWSFTFAARVEHHFMDTQITDRVTGSTANVDSQSPVGAYLSVNYSF